MEGNANLPSNMTTTTTAAAQNSSKPGFSPLFIRVIYSDLEKQVLRGLIQKYEHIVENKRTDKATMQMKNKTWEEIGKEFNAFPGVTFREVKSLRKCWDNTKNAAKEEFRNGRPEVYRACGRIGGPTPSEECQKVYALMKDEVDSPVNPSDCDNDSMQDASMLALPEGPNSVSDASMVALPEGPNSLHSDTNMASRTFDFDTDEEESPRKRKRTSAYFAQCGFEEEEHKLKMEIFRNRREYQRKEHEQRMEAFEAERFYWEEKRKRL